MAGSARVKAAADFNADRLRLASALAGTSLGDRRAFHDLYQWTNRKLFGVCLQICDDRHVAEDLLHDVFVIVWKRAHQFDSQRGSAITWLAAIARNRAIDWKRQASTRRSVPIDEALVVVDLSTPADDQIAATQARDAVLLCLSDLTPSQRTAITDAFLGGHTYQELSRRYDIPLSTVKSRVARGLASLRVSLVSALA